MRVHELAKKMNVSSKDILAKLHSLGVEAKNHMSSIEDTAIGLLQEEHGVKDSDVKSQPPTDLPKQDSTSISVKEEDSTSAIQEPDESECVVPLLSKILLSLWA